LNKTLHNAGVRITATSDVPRYIVETRAWKVALEEIEEGRFHAFSESRKQCSKCRMKTSRKAAVDCPGCKLPLEPMAYLIDVSENRGLTRCSCENYTCNKRGEQSGQMALCCKHGAAALILYGHFQAVELANRHAKKP